MASALHSLRDWHHSSPAAPRARHGSPSSHHRQCGPVEDEDTVSRRVRAQMLGHQVQRTRLQHAKHAMPW